MEERDTPDLPPGTDVDGMVVEARVAAGGYGTVYRARDPLTGLLLALKLIPIHRAEASARREAVLAMPFQHRNLMRLVGCGYWPSTLPRFFWLKMLYVEGRPLDAWAWEENPDAREVVGKMLGVARGLAVVHDQGVVHRDVKEANILVRERDGEPVLVDFGAARGEDQSTLTEGLYPPGTPLYRSPEAWRFGREHGHERKVHYRPGKADDLYALGVVLYRLLTRGYPFLVTKGDARSMRSVIDQVPLPPHIVNPNVPLAVSAVCMKLLEKRPEDRHPSALALCEELGDLLARADASWRLPLHDGPHPPRSEPPGSVRAVALQALRRAGVGMVMLASLVLVDGGLAGKWKAEPASPPVASSPSLPTQRGLPGQEMAPSSPPPDIEWAAAPPLVDATPAAVAPPVTRSKDDALKKPQAPNSQGDKKQKRTLSPVAGWCLGAAAAANTACPGAQVRAATEATACPEGVVETMTETLGIPIGNEEGAAFLFGEDYVSGPVSVREGFTSVTTGGHLGRNLPAGSILSGRLYFGEGRIYGRFTEARTPKGDTFKVCVEMWQEGKRGAEMEPGSRPPDTARIWNVVDVKAVSRFE